MNDTAVRLTSLEGVSAEAQLNTQSIAGYDGSSLVSAQTNERRIVVSFRIRMSADAEQAQHDMYRLFAPKSAGTMTMAARLGTSKIDYVVESCIIPPNVKPIVGQLVLLCPDPFFRALQSTTSIIAGSVSCFKMPFTFPNEPFYISKRQESVFATVDNTGEADTGMIITFTALSRVVNPALINVNTGDTARLNFTMESGDVIHICTEKGAKSITLVRSGVEINIFNYKAYPFVFLQLAAGENLFKFEADSGSSDLEITAKFSPKYAGIYTNAPGAVDRMSDTEIEAELEKIGYIVKRGGLYG